MAATDDGRSTNDNKQLGTSVEKYRANVRDGFRVPEAWFDVEAGDGTLVEVKSTERRLSYGRRGRYQIEQENHENLVDHGGEYDLVLRDGESTAAERTMTADEVEDLIDEHDLKWPDAGKLKLPWSYVHDPENVEGEA